jgi:hypothetical protein
MTKRLALIIFGTLCIIGFTAMMYTEVIQPGAILWNDVNREWLRLNFGTSVQEALWFTVFFVVTALSWDSMREEEGA